MDLESWSKLVQSTTVNDSLVATLYSASPLGSFILKETPNSHRVHDKALFPVLSGRTKEILIFEAICKKGKPLFCYGTIERL